MVGSLFMGCEEDNPEGACTTIMYFGNSDGNGSECIPDNNSEYCTDASIKEACYNEALAGDQYPQQSRWCTFSMHTLNLGQTCEELGYEEDK